MLLLLLFKVDFLICYDAIRLLADERELEKCLHLLVGRTLDEIGDGPQALSDERLILRLGAELADSLQRNFLQELVLHVDGYFGVKLRLAEGQQIGEDVQNALNDLDRLARDKQRVKVLQQAIFLN